MAQPDPHVTELARLMREAFAQRAQLRTTYPLGTAIPSSTGSGKESTRKTIVKHILYVCSCFLCMLWRRIMMRMTLSHRCHCSVLALVAVPVKLPQGSAVSVSIFAVFLPLLTINRSCMCLFVALFYFVFV